MGSCCPQGVPSWPASGLGLSGGAPSGEKPRQEEAASWGPSCAALTCPVTWACLPTSLHRFLILCHTRCLGFVPGIPPGSRPCKAWRLCSHFGQSHTCEVCVNLIPCCRVPITSCRGARPAEIAVLCWNSCSNWASPLKCKNLCLCWYVCVCVYMYVCTHACTCVCVYCVPVCAHLYMCVRVHMYMYMCVQVYTCVCILHLPLTV